VTITASNFPYVRELVLERSGVSLVDEQEYLVEARLGPLAREMGLDSGRDVVEALRRDGDSLLASRVVEAMVTGETSWFRDLHPFECLKTVVLPKAIEANRTRRSLSIWSAACSTGQELYSLAMMLDTFFPETSHWQLKLVGTDMSSGAIAKASEGTFTPLEMNRGLPAMMLAHYFSRDGSRYRISDHIRKMVQFDVLNLVRDWLPPSTFDIVLLRNVLIYFDTPVKKQVLSDVWARVGEGGYLFLGATETAIGLSDSMAPVHKDGATYYVKAGN